jgi:hypothetical protein
MMKERTKLQLMVLSFLAIVAMGLFVVKAFYAMPGAMDVCTIPLICT